MASTIEPLNNDAIRDRLDTIYRNESRQILATLIRLLGDFDLAEEAVQDAFAAALQTWPKEGVPHNPKAWLISAGRFRAIDSLRRRARFNASLEKIASEIDAGGYEETVLGEDVQDDTLRLVFTCCHPALPLEGQIALTLREVCGLTTEEIARAFLSSPPTVAQRIVRAKGKIRDANIPYEVPEKADLPERIDAVLRVIYLTFNEGYSASSGGSLTRADLSQEAIRLARLLYGLMPETEVGGLLALTLLQESRRRARTTESGDLILLEDQDRSLWDHDLIEEGQRLVETTLRSGPVGAYSLQAAIAAVHASATKPSETDWNQIVGLYDLLLRSEPSPVVELNRAVAIAMRDGESAGLDVIDRLLEEGRLEDYYPLHSTRAELCRRLGRKADARQSYRRALELTRLEPEQRFLRQRLSLL
jgi:RNA polymerase sigma-70 factor (ECF subfamily)